MVGPWKPAIETLVLRLGPWTLAKWNFEALSNRTNPLAAEIGSPKPPSIIQPMVYRQLRDDGTIRRALVLERNAIRYVPYRGKRHFVDLAPRTFDDYFSEFSAKTRNTLKRKLRHFAKQPGGMADFRVYSSPEEMIEFRRHALTVSLLSYQRKIGFGFPETAEFETSLLQQAADRRVCGFVLMKQDKPVSYVFCWINQDIVTYSYCGYDPEFAKSSPGTVLLFLIIKWLFNQNKYRLFDLGNDSWNYKTMFATGAVRYLKVIWFPRTVSNFVLIIAHLSVLRTWSAAALAKTTCASWIGKAKTTVRRLKPRHETDVQSARADRPTTTPPEPQPARQG